MVASSSQRRSCVLVLGMHRSGTSALTRVLNLMGASLPRHVLGANDSNEAGHWEPAHLLLINDDILAALNSRWDDWRPLRVSAPDQVRIGPLLDAAAETIGTEYGDAPLIVVKDPRICRMMALYPDILSKAGLQPHIVLSLRNPLAVMASLARRNEMSRDTAGLLWLRHILDAEFASRHYPRTIQSFERLMESWRPTLDAMRRTLGIEWPTALDGIAPAITSFLNPTLRHHLPEAGDVAEADSTSVWIGDSYRAMLALESNPSDTIAMATLDRIRGEFDAVAAPYAEVSCAELLDGAVNPLRGEGIGEGNHASPTEGGVTGATAPPEQAHGSTGSLALQLVERQGEIKARDAAIRCLQDTIDGLRTDLDHVNRSIVERDAEILQLTQARMALTAETQSLSALATERHQAAVEQQKTAEQSTQAIAALRHAKEELEARLAIAEADTASARAEAQTEVRRLERRMSRKDGEAADLRRMLQTMEHSLSWRVTRPIRSAKFLVWRFGVSGYRWLRRHVPALGSRLFRLRQSFKWRHEIQLLQKSELFDPAYYETHYPDYRQSGLSAIVHYLAIGALEGRNPSARFDTYGYLEAHPEIDAYRTNPLVHLLQSGAPEPHASPHQGALRSPARAIEALLAMTHDVPVTFPPLPEAVTVIVPVYNGLAHLERLVPTLLRHTDRRHTILIVDDASPDPAVATYLQRVTTNEPNVKLNLRTENLGFVRTINAAATGLTGHFAILNSDTEVPPFWLERLMAPIFEQGDVASTTPFSNAATIFSFPAPNRDNDLLEGLTLARIDAAFARIRPPADMVLDAPTGVGFCMGINGQAWQQLGGFDAETFGRGYCEENDWCQRARAAGFDNVLAPNLFVFHAHSGSFLPGEKSDLLTRNMQRLLERWPGYTQAVADFVRRDPWHTLRRAVLLDLALSDAPMLIIDHDLGGGANEFRRQMGSGARAAGRTVITICPHIGGQSLRAHVEFAGQSATYLSEDQTSGLQALLLRLENAHIVCNELVGWPEPLQMQRLLAQETPSSCRLSILFHDYFAVCPSQTLLNHAGLYCGVPDDLDACRVCLKQNVHAQPTTSDIAEWRRAWQSLLDRADTIEFFSQSSLAIAQRALTLDPEKVNVRGHTALPHAWEGAVRPAAGGPLILALVGAINFAKGAALLKPLSRHLGKVDPDARLVIIGEIDPEFQFEARNVTVHGRYDRDDLEDLICRYGVQVCVVASIWPETFSYVTQELMLLGMPIVAFDLGAPAERLRHYELAELTDAHTPDAIVEAAIRLVKRLGSRPATPHSQPSSLLDGAPSSSN